MSLLRTKGLQIGQDGTATNNFTLYQPGVPDGTLRIGNGNNGSVTDAITLSSSGNVGIGTSSPVYKLSVNSGSTNTAASFTSTTGNGYLRISGDNLATHMTIGQDTTGTYIYSATGTPTRILQGGNTRLNIDSNGYVTKPNHPTFSARLGTTISTPGASSDIVFDLIQTNVGNHYNTSNGQFTAPVAGIYRFHSVLQFHNGSAQIYAGAGFQVNNTNITSGYTNQYTTNAHALWAGEFVTSLSQNDVVNVTYFGQAATAPSIQGGNRSWFVGYLIG